MFISRLELQRWSIEICYFLFKPNYWGFWSLANFFRDLLIQILLRIMNFQDIYS
jgi:hypothetical protein